MMNQTDPKGIFMKKIVVLLENSTDFNTVILVENYDKKFEKIIRKVNRVYDDTPGTGEYKDLIRRLAADAGYKVTFPEYQTISG